MFIFAIDQAARSGYCFGDSRCPRDLTYGETMTHADRLHAVDALRGALQEAGNPPLHVVFEDHSDFYFGRGNSSVKAMLGLGRAQGEWSSLILCALSPESWHSVTPKVWRKAVLGLVGNANADRAKEEAKRWACAWLNVQGIGENAAEAVAIWAWAAQNLALKIEYARQTAALARKARRKGAA